MGSIVFPASHVMVSWMKEVDKKNPGYWNKRNTVGKRNVNKQIFVKTVLFQSSVVELASWASQPRLAGPMRHSVT